MDNRKKILFLVTQSEFGGAQRFIYTLTNNLNKNNYEIIIGAGKEGDDENGLLNLLEKQGIKTERLKHLKRSINPFFDLLALFEIKKLLKKERPNTLFLCSSKAGFLGSLAWQLNSKFKIQNSKLIYRIGGWTFNDPWSKWKKKLYIWLEKFSARWKDYIINNAESDYQQAIKLGIKARKENLVIYNGIGDLDFLSKEEARIQISEILKLNQNSKLEIQNFVVGTIANDYPAKGLKYLREAEKKMPDVKVVILSGIPNAYKYLKAFDVFVLPSVKEGFPWVILEALKAEIPIVATCVGAVPEILDQCIEPGNVDELIRVIKNPKKFKFNEKFSLKTMIDKYITLFESTN